MDKVLIDRLLTLKQKKRQPTRIAVFHFKTKTVIATTTFSTIGHWLPVLILK